MAHNTTTARVFDLEQGAAIGELQLAVDEHPLLAGKDARFGCTHRYHRAGAGVSMLSGRS